MAHRRVELAKVKARKALVEAYQEHTNRPGGRPTDAYGELAGEFARSAYANAMNKPREAVEAGRFALRLAGMEPAEERAERSGAAVVLELSAEAVELARELIANRRP